MSCDNALLTTGASPAKSAAQAVPPTLSTVWRDPTLWMSVGVAAVVLGVQGVRVGLFDTIGLWVTTHKSDVRLSPNDTHGDDID